MAERDPYLVPGLLRGLQALRAFSPLRPEMGLSEIAEALGVSRSAAFRTVYTLAAEGCLLAVGPGPRYRLGPAVVGLGYGYHASRELLEVAQPPLERLRDACDWSAHLGVLDGRHILYLLRIPASDGLSSLVHVGSRLPAASTSMGRVFLAHRSTRFVRALYRGLEPAALQRILEARKRDRRQPHVASLGSFETGLCSVAAPVRDLGGGVVAAISATKNTDRIPAKVVDLVLRTAESIGRGLGWQPSDGGG